MKLRPFQKYNRDDYRNAKPWFYTFLDNANFMVDTLNALLQNNVDIDNNLLAERQTVSITHNVPLTIKLQKLSANPSLVRPGYASGKIVTGCSITSYNTDGTLAVTVLFSDAPTTAVTVTLVMEP